MPRQGSFPGEQQARLFKAFVHKQLGRGQEPVCGSFGTGPHKKLIMRV